MFFRRALLAVLALAPALAARPAHATTVVPVTVEDLARRADEMVVATPRAARAFWLGSHIVTDVELEVQTTARGTLAPRARVTVRLPGGVVGRLGQVVPGVPELAISRPYLVFLTRAGDVPGIFYLAHLTAAVLPLVSAPGGGVVAMPPAEGLVTRPDLGPTSATPATVMSRTGVAVERLLGVLRSVR
jgi:hypothetical protein